MSDFHRWAREQETSEIGISYPHILDSDAMKPVKGVPKKLEIVNGWKIMKSDVKKIIGNGYVLIQDGELIVRESKSRLLSSIEAKPGVFGFSIDLKKLFGLDK